jgi:A/G-specific adenine glycosylase
MSATHLSLPRRRLLAWYEKHKRDLPWRRTDDPYAIWISETMLQQTQVKTVLPYYERFLKVLPTIETLDQARLEQVLRLWSGLGYYRRAENLKKAARQIMRAHEGAIPKEYKRLRALPGIGDYTAGAILSIAFQQPYPAVDGNVRRVLGRILGLTNENELRETAKQLVPKSKPGNFNQALMELGATICIPKDPRCPQCPVAAKCAAGSKSKRPEPSKHLKSSSSKNVIWPLAMVRSGEKILLRRRAATGLLAGLWELPGGETVRSETVTATLRRHVKELSVMFKGYRRIGEFRHSITHRRIYSPIFLLELGSTPQSRLASPHWRWVRPAALHRYAVSSMTTKAAKVLAAYDKSSL